MKKAKRFAVLTLPDASRSGKRIYGMTVVEVTPESWEKINMQDYRYVVDLAYGRDNQVINMKELTEKQINYFFGDYMETEQFKKWIMSMSNSTIYSFKKDLIIKFQEKIGIVPWNKVKLYLYDHNSSRWVKDLGYPWAMYKKQHYKMLKEEVGLIVKDDAEYDHFNKFRYEKILGEKKYNQLYRKAIKYCIQNIGWNFTFSDKRTHVLAQGVRVLSGDYLEGISKHFNTKDSFINTNYDFEFYLEYTQDRKKIVICKTKEYREIVDIMNKNNYPK